MYGYDSKTHCKETLTLSLASMCTLTMLGALEVVRAAYCAL